MEKGIFVVFEGPEGGGKTTQAELLLRAFDKTKTRAIPIREPGGTPVGEVLRKILKDDREYSVSPRTEFLLFQAARAAVVEDVIRPALKSGYVVIADRYYLSTLAYQVGGRGLPLQASLDTIRYATEGLEPDVVFLLLVDPEEGLRRAKERGKPDRFEGEALEFHRRVHNSYNQFRTAHDTCLSLDTIANSEKETHSRVVQFIKTKYPYLGL